MAKQDTDNGDGETSGGGFGRSMWSGTISFGLVSIPVALMSGVRSAGVRMRMLDEDGTPLRRRYYCPAEDVEVHPEHIVRGYETAPDQYIVVRDEELEALEPKKSRDIDLQRFVALDSVDPIYFNRPYFLVPAGDSTKAYRLLAEVMEKTNQVGIATFVMRDKEYLVAILAQGGILQAETLRFEDEIRTRDFIGLPERTKAAKKQVDAMKRSIRNASAAKFDPGELTDDYSRAVRELVERKVEQDQDIVEGPQYTGEEEESSVQDLMASLQASLSGARQRRHGDDGGERTPPEDGRKKQPAPDRRGEPAAGADESLPFANYDKLTVREVRDRVGQLTDADEVQRLEEYERRHKDRKTVHELLEKRRDALETD